MKTIYFAGPDVFNQAYPQQKNEIRAMCAACGLTPLLPGDLELDTAEAIFRHNLTLDRPSRWGNRQPQPLSGRY